VSTTHPAPRPAARRLPSTDGPLADQVYRTAEQVGYVLIEATSRVYRVATGSTLEDGRVGGEELRLIRFWLTSGDLVADRPRTYHHRQRCGPGRPLLAQPRK
jgi:hypothetical protein